MWTNASVVTKGPECSFASSINKREALLSSRVFYDYGYFPPLVSRDVLRQVRVSSFPSYLVDHFSGGLSKSAMLLIGKRRLTELT
jgi:hypothetical protein